VLEYRLRKGLDLPIEGAPASEIDDTMDVSTVAVLGADYIGLKPRISVQEGDVVGRGAALFAHKDTPDALITAPVGGRIKAINRGARRVLISIEIEVNDSAADPVDFTAVGDTVTADGIREKICASGLWTSFRTRPYSKVPSPDSAPSAIYITAIDTEPLAPDPAIIISQAADAFSAGVKAVAKLTDGRTYVCSETGANIPVIEEDRIIPASFSGPHPAGLASTHMHFIEPPSAQKTVWAIGYQDVIAIGRLMLTGQLDGERIIGLCGPICHTPRLVRTILGASMADLTRGEIDLSVPPRFISGSVLSGRAGQGASAYLGRYARQLTVMEEDRKQIPFGWIRPMASKYSFQPVLGSALSNRLFKLTTNLNGGRRAMVPTGIFETLMPQDFLPTQLLRSLLIMDTDMAQALGALELDEEDLGLVGFACPAKYEYAVALRDCLTKIEKEG